MNLILPSIKMRLESCEYLVFYVILYFKLISVQRDLPKDAKIVQRCPEPKNRTAWDIASKNLGCTHSGNISFQQSHVYHCLPSSLLNEYVELCGITAPISGGNCPVLHYVNTSGRNRSPTSWNCSTFSSGCPMKFYYSRDVYMYPKCLDIDSDQRCFKADRRCMINLNATSTIKPDVLTNNNEDKSSIPFYVIGSLLFIISFLLLIIVRLSFLLKRSHDAERDYYTGEGIQEAFLLKYEEEIQKQERRNRCTYLLYKTLGFNEKYSSQIKWSPVTRLLCEIAVELPDEKIERLKFLLKSNNVKNATKKDLEISALQRYDLIIYMDRKYDFNVNMYILMGYLEAIKEEELLKKCKEFVKNPPHPLIFYQRENEDADAESTRVYLKVAMDIKAFKHLHLHEILDTLQRLLSCKEDQILVRGISEGCIMLHLDVNNTLINMLRKCDLTRMSTHKIFKISIIDECIFYDPKLDDNYQRQTVSKQSFPGRMLDCFCLLLCIFPKLCKMFWRLFQIRTNKERCNQEDLVDNYNEIIKIEPYKRPSESRGMTWTEDLRKRRIICKEKVTATSWNYDPQQSINNSVPLKRTQSRESLGEKSQDEPKEEILEGVSKRHRQGSKNGDSRGYFGSFSLERKIKDTETIKKEEKTNIESIERNQQEVVLYARDPSSIQEIIDRNGEKEVREELTDLHSCSDFRITSSYDCIQEDIAELYESIQTLIHRPAFEEHIRPDMHEMKDINFEQLDLRKKDLMMTECAILFAGETSSGKSTIINLIIGEDILPTDIMATTTGMFRIRYSEKRKFSVLNKDEKVLALSEFNDEEELLEMLEDIARTCDQQTKYIDICFPVPLLKGNIIIVDTPGKKDSGHDILANKMLDYLPNAVAFIFVVNVAKNCVFQDDRLSHVIRHVRQSMSEMNCFEPHDAIFLLNKWDTVIPQKRKRKKDLYEELKEKLHEIWEDAKDTNILKFASAKVHIEEAYTTEFESFYEILKEVISKNQFKRVSVHLRFIESFVDECYLSTSYKLKYGRQNTDNTMKDIDQLCRDLQVIKDRRNETYSDHQKRMETFLDETAEDLNQYIHSAEFQSNVLQGTEKYTRFTIGRELDTRIEKAIFSWQEENIGTLVERKVLQNLKDNFIILHEHLHKMEDKMRGMKTPFDVEKKLGPVLDSLISTSSTAVAGSMAMMYMSVNPRATQVLAAKGIVTGLVKTGLVAIDVLDDFETVTKKAYQAMIKEITKEKIRKTLQNKYEDFQLNVRNYLEGDLKYVIDELTENVNKMKSKINLYKKEESNLLSLDSEITKIRNRLEEIKQVEIKLE